MKGSLIPGDTVMITDNGDDPSDQIDLNNFLGQ